MKGINTKFTDMWDAKIEKNMRQRITQVKGSHKTIFT